MGWWGVQVMEGDPALDAEGFIFDQLLEGLPESSPNNDEDEDGDEKIWQRLKVRGVANKILASIKDEFCAQDPLDDLEDMNIHIQVLGEAIMCGGGLMPKAVRTACINAAKNDVWASEDDDRRAAMNEYAERVRNYVDGVPIQPISHGLLDALAQLLNS